jgi:uncharacterized membrane protein YedE/YeeE
MDGVSPKTWVIVLGFLAGMVFGATAQKTHFCTMGGISDMVLMGDSRRFRSWMLAVAVALVGTQILWGLGYIDLGTAIYRTPNLGWLGAIVGGLMFGFGMVQAGGCGNKTLVRLGAGNLKSLVVFLVLAATATMTLHGLFGFGRVRLENAANLALASSQGIDDLLMQATGLPAPALRWVLGAMLGGGLALWCLKDAEFRGDRTHLLAGLLIGLLIPAGWFITGALGQDEFEPVPVASFTFIAPIGDTVQYLMTFTGASINFGIASVAGVVAGSFTAAVATGTFRWEAFSSVQDLAGSLIGAAMMGVGGSLALGCTIGQGLSGVSTLALGSFLALLAICAGGYYGVRHMEEGSHAAVLRALLLNRLTTIPGERPR